MDGHLLRAGTGARGYRASSGRTAGHGRDRGVQDGARHLGAGRTGRRGLDRQEGVDGGGRPAL